MTQNILFVQRIRDLGALKTLTLVFNPDRKSPVFVCDSDVNNFVPIVAIAMNNRIDQTLPYCHAHLMLAIFVHAGSLRGTNNVALRKVHRFERGGVVLVDHRSRSYLFH